MSAGGWDPLRAPFDGVWMIGATWTRTALAQDLHNGTYRVYSSSTVYGLDRDRDLHHDLDRESISSMRMAHATVVEGASSANFLQDVVLTMDGSR